MSDTLYFPLALCAAVAVAYVLALTAIRGAHAARLAAQGVLATLTAPFASALGRNEGASRRSRLESEIRRELGNDNSFEDFDRAQIIAAAVASQEINLINRKLREGVRHCLRSHWAVVEGSGATHMSEAARHPFCRYLRSRVIDLAELLSDRIAQYPLILDSPDLIKLHVGLRWIPATCLTCPYRTHAVADAPRLCPTARAMFGANPNAAVLDGEVVDDCP